MLHHVKVEPIRFGFDSEALGVRVVRGVGYRAKCECGYVGSRKSAWALARLDGIAHRKSVESHD